MTRLLGVQYLRAVAALAVVVFHAADKTGYRFTVGAAGVDIFFVISGFVMWTLAETKPVSPLAFYRDRILRIAPPYWIITAVMAAGALAGLFPRIRLTLDHLAASLAFIPHRSPSNGEIWPLLAQGWTLDLEMFFYLIFGLVLVLPPKRRLAALATVFVGLVAAGWYCRPDDPLLAIYTRPIILEFLCGAALGRLWLADGLPGRSTAIMIIVVSLAGFAGLAFYPRMIHEFLFGLLAILLVLGVLAVERSGPVTRLPLLGYLGGSSYSIYLWHTLAISVVAKAAGLLSLGALPTLAAAVLAGTLLGVVAHEFVEKPLVALMKPKHSRAAGTGMTAAAAGLSPSERPRL